jgi:hypothetical protein
MPFFRANLIGLKADRDKKEIGIDSTKFSTLLGVSRTKHTVFLVTIKSRTLQLSAFDEKSTFEFLLYLGI